MQHLSDSNYKLLTPNVLKNFEGVFSENSPETLFFEFFATHRLSSGRVLWLVFKIQYCFVLKDLFSKGARFLPSIRGLPRRVGKAPNWKEWSFANFVGFGITSNFFILNSILAYPIAGGVEGPILYFPISWNPENCWRGRTEVPTRQMLATLFFYSFAPKSDKKMRDPPNITPIPAITTWGQWIGAKYRKRSGSWCPSTNPSSTIATPKHISLNLFIESHLFSVFIGTIIGSISSNSPLSNLLQSGELGWTRLVFPSRPPVFSASSASRLCLAPVLSAVAFAKAECWVFCAVSCPGYNIRDLFFDSLGGFGGNRVCARYSWPFCGASYYNLA